MGRTTSRDIDMGDESIEGDLVGMDIVVQGCQNQEIEVAFPKGC